MHPQLYALAPGTLKTSNHPTDFATESGGWDVSWCFYPRKVKNGEAKRLMSLEPQSLTPGDPKTCAKDTPALLIWNAWQGKLQMHLTAQKSKQLTINIYIYILYDTWTVHKLELQMLEFSVIDNSCYIVWQCRTLQAESPKNNPTQQPHRGPAVPVRPALEAWLRPHVKSRASCGRSWEMISIIDGYVFMDPWCIMNQRAQKKSS